jgi:hypothetical protein
MSYPKLVGIPKAERTIWSPERGGRTWQRVAGKRVPKFSYSPFTAKARKEYTFYADVELKVEIESPPNSGKKMKYATVVLTTGTYLEFRDFVLSGEAAQRVKDVVGVYGGEEITGASYWRNRGKSDEP